MTRARDVGDRGYEQSPKLIAEYDLAGVDTSVSPLEIPIDATYNYVIRSANLLHNTTDVAIYLRFGDSTSVKVSNYVFMLTRQTLAAGYAGTSGSDAANIFLCRLSTGTGGAFVIDITGGSELKRCRALAQTGGYDATNGPYVTNVSGLWSGSGGGAMTRVQLTSEAGTFVSGTIRVMRMPKQ